LDTRHIKESNIHVLKMFLYIILETISVIRKITKICLRKDTTSSIIYINIRPFIKQYNYSMIDFIYFSVPII